MTQKELIGVMLGAVIVVGLGVVGYVALVKKPASVAPQPIPTSSGQPTEDLVSTPAATGETTDQPTYRNDAYGFEFTYPANSTVETRPDTNYQYVRLQNYTPTDDLTGLAPGEYYLEAFIFDHSLGHNPSQPCSQSVIDSKPVALGTVTGYRGYGEEGGDAGGTRFALCVERPNVDFYIQGTENSAEAPLVNSIFDSFKFTR